MSPLWASVSWPTSLPPRERWAILFSMVLLFHLNLHPISYQSFDLVSIPTAGTCSASIHFSPSPLLASSSKVPSFLIWYFISLLTSPLASAPIFYPHSSQRHLFFKTVNQTMSLPSWNQLPPNPHLTCCALQNLDPACLSDFISFHSPFICTFQPALDALSWFLPGSWLPRATGFVILGPRISFHLTDSLSSSLRLVVAFSS